MSTPLGGQVIAPDDYKDETDSLEDQIDFLTAEFVAFRTAILRNIRPGEAIDVTDSSGRIHCEFNTAFDDDVTPIVVVGWGSNPSVPLLGPYVVEGSADHEGFDVEFLYATDGPELPDPDPEDEEPPDTEWHAGEAAEGITVHVMFTAQNLDLNDVPE